MKKLVVAALLTLSILSITQLLLLLVVVTPRVVALRSLAVAVVVAVAAVPLPISLSKPPLGGFSYFLVIFLSHFFAPHHNFSFVKLTFSL